MNISIRPATLADLPSINTIIESAVMGWDIPERVKRLSLSSLSYSADDFNYYQIMILEHDHVPTGVLTLDHDTYRQDKTSLIHGIYVAAGKQKKGIGNRLLAEAEMLARQQQSCNIMVKAQKDAAGFFEACGMQKLAIENEQQDFSSRYIKAII